MTSGGSGKRKVSATAVPRSVCGNGPCCVQGLPVGEQTALVCSALAHGTASSPECHENALSQIILFRGGSDISSYSHFPCYKSKDT